MTGLHGSASADVPRTLKTAARLVRDITGPSASGPSIERHVHRSAYLKLLPVETKRLKPANARRRVATIGAPRSKRKSGSVRATTTAIPAFAALQAGYGCNGCRGRSASTRYFGSIVPAVRQPFSAGKRRRSSPRPRPTRRRSSACRVRAGGRSRAPTPNRPACLHRYGGSALRPCGCRCAPDP
jgi:hypothetical protein